MVQADASPWPAGQVVHATQAPLSSPPLNVAPDVHGAQVVSCVVLQGSVWPCSTEQVAHVEQVLSPAAAVYVLPYAQAVQVLAMFAVPAPENPASQIQV